MLIPIAKLFNPLGTIGEILIFVYLIIGVVIPFFILPKYIAKGIIQIIIDTDSIQLIWVKYFLGSAIKKPLKFRFDEIKSYKFEPSNNFDTIKIEFNSGEKLKIHRWLYDKKDDFNKFMTLFKRKIEAHNKKKSTVTPIKKERLIMENKTFLLIIGIVIALLIIFAIALIFIMRVSNIKGIVSLLIVIGPLIWVAIQVVNGLKKIKKDDAKLN
jgi:hypothetical protein